MAALVLVAGCGSDPGFNETTDFIRTEGSAQFINMMPDSPEITFIHGLSTSQIRFPFTSGVEPRISDNYDWRAAYLNSNGDEVTVIEGDDQVISESVQSTFLLMGNLAQPNVQVVDIPLTPLEQRPESEAEIWFAASLSQHSMVDIYLTGFGESLEASTPVATLDSGTYSPLQNLPAGNSRQLRVTTAGTFDLLFDSGEIVIASQSLELFALVDDFGPTSENHVDVIRSLAANRTVIPNTAQPTVARVVNFSTVDPLAVSVGAQTYNGVVPSQVTDYLGVPAGNQSVIVSGPAGETSNEDGLLPQGQYLSLVVFDDLTAESQPATRAAIVEDNLRGMRDRAHFQFVNGSNVQIDFYALRGDESTDDIAPTFDNVGTTISGSVEVLIGQARFVALTSDGSETLDSIEANIIEGITYTVVFDAQQRLRLLDD